MRRLSECYHVPQSRRILVFGNYTSESKSVSELVYKELIQWIFHKNHVDFHNIQEASSVQIDHEIIIVGGGDVATHSNIEELKKTLLRTNIPCYALSVSLPDDIDLARKFLLLFDHVYVRSLLEYKTAVEFIGKENVTVLQDIAFLFLNFQKIPFQRPSLTTRFKIGLALSQSIASCNDRFVKDVCTLLCTFDESLDVEFYLYSFYFTDNMQESDRTVNSLLYNLYREANSSRKNIFYVKQNFVQNIQSLTDMIRNMDIMICSRYHSIVTCLTLGKPFVALYTSNKVECLLEEAGASQNGIKIDSDFNLSHVTDAIIENLHNKNINAPPVVFPRLFQRYMKAVLTILNLKRKRLTQQVLREGIRQKLVDFQFLTINCIDTMLNKLTRDSFKSEINKTAKSLLGSNHDVDELAMQIQSYLSTNSSETKENIKQVIEREHHKQLEDLKNLQVVLSKRTQLNYSGNVLTLLRISSEDLVSRGIWNYVVHPLLVFDAETYQRSANMIVDVHTEKTFSDVQRLQSFVYPWIGIIRKDGIDLSDLPSFRSALRNCCGLVVFSRVISEKLKNKLCEVMQEDIPHIPPIYTLNFPISNKHSLVKFRFQNFLRNQDKLLLQLNASSVRLPITCRVRICTIHSNDFWNPGHPKNRYKSQLSLERALAENVLYTKVGASGEDAALIVNCIVRNIPVIINRNELTEDLLGINYPGFYETSEDVINIASNLFKIWLIHIYIRYLIRKENFSVHIFIASFAQLLSHVYVTHSNSH